ncbi:hypothetical protein OGAPHI_002572 [Ogataea philodendri]|uniref:Membrane insertase YidC/Oxa/ALB C-terminal domain-containing protein n=1 Tax=Ogataea philodendri TaxID=1378263 RepID=A0A9P8PCL3_9ASCO|nr:uncharacterized protein OGAPHI_002572 [Ogataea philodendri]KAH3668817.1 hypothetical protein OGAPHI_002572 [Ogataea philodendri]
MWFAFVENTPVCEWLGKLTVIEDELDVTGLAGFLVEISSPSNDSSNWQSLGVIQREASDSSLSSSLEAMALAFSKPLDFRMSTNLSIYSSFWLNKAGLDPRIPLVDSLVTMVSRMSCFDFGCSLVWTLKRNVQVLALDLGQLGEFDAQVVQVAGSNGLVQDLWQGVDTNVERTSLLELCKLLSEVSIVSLEQSNLSKNLVGERTGHDKRSVSGGTSQVDQSTVSKQNHVLTGLEQVSVNLWLDVDCVNGIGLKPSNVDLNVEVTNVTHNGVLWHDGEVLTSDDVSATGGGNEDLTLWGSLLHGGDLVAGNSSLQSVDRVDLSNDDSSTHTSQSHGTTFTNVTETSNNGNFTSDHDIGGSLDTIDQRLSATVQVVELGLGDGVVDVDGWNLEVALLQHLVQVVDTSGGLLRKSETVLQHIWVLLVDKGGQVSTIVQDQVELLVVLESKQLLLNTPQVLLLGLTLPGENWNTSSSNGSSSVVLGGVDVTRRPGNLSTKSDQGLDQNSSLDSHVLDTRRSGIAGLLVILADVVSCSGTYVHRLHQPAQHAGSVELWSRSTSFLRHELFSVFEEGAQLISAAHAAVGLPWWAFIPLATFAVRTVTTLPLAVYQRKGLQRQNELRPMIGATFPVSKIRLAASAQAAQQNARANPSSIIKTEAEKLSADKIIVLASKERMRRQRQIFKDNGCQSWKFLFLPALQIPLWITLSQSFRVLTGWTDVGAMPLDPTLSTEGLGYLVNLTFSDPYFVLPITLGITALTNAEWNFRTADLMKLTTRGVKNTLRPTAFDSVITLSRMSICFLVVLSTYAPAALSLYWISSNVFSFIQNVLLNKLIPLRYTPYARSSSSPKKRADQSCVEDSRSRVPVTHSDTPETGEDTDTKVVCTVESENLALDSVAQRRYMQFIVI